MARPSHPPDLAALGFGDEFDEVLRGANPNPTRQGCPSHEVLAALARRERPIEDAAYEHLLDCSPCYIEVRNLQRAHLTTMHDRPARRWWMTVAAAAVVVLAIGAWLFTAGRNGSPATTGSPAATQVTLDLRPYSVTRSPTAADAPPPLELPPNVIEVTLFLPTGSEPGSYDVQIMSAERRSLAAARAEAVLENFVTTLRTRLDLRELPSGDHELALRRDGDGWRVYRITVR